MRALHPHHRRFQEGARIRPAFRTSLLAATLLPGLTASEAVAQTPSQSLFEWATPPFPASEYRARRARLVEALDGDSGVFIALAGHGLSHGDTFRQLDDFSYLVGLELPRSVLAADGATGTLTMFVPASDARYSSPSRPNDFPGRALAADPEIRAWVGDVQIRDAESFSAFMDSLSAKPGHGPHQPGVGRDPSPAGTCRCSTRTTARPMLPGPPCSVGQMPTSAPDIQSWPRSAPSRARWKSTSWNAPRG